MFLLLLIVYFSPVLGACPSRLFSFGDSLADTGNVAEVFPSVDSLFSTSIVHRKTLSNHLIDRVGNGRLLIDFVAEAFGFPLLQPYYRRNHPEFRHGVNFAFSGATARNTSIVVPFYLFRQVNNYVHLRNSTKPESLGNGLYWISIGINDFLQNYIMNNFTVSLVKSEVVPEAVDSVIQAIQRLYAFGARKFMVLSVPALGCLPQFLSKFGKGVSSDYDSFGCLINHNDAARAYATLLESSVDELRHQLKDAHLIYGNYYQIHLDVVENPTKFGECSKRLNQKSVHFLAAGFDKDGTLAACFEDGTPHCKHPNSFITWDGLHFSEGFNLHAAKELLRSTSFNSLCFKTQLKHA